ncbi:MAG: hypothetical protein ABSB35_05640 [Bryobacteraceae bacterium]|jgi:hypothetical protein
MSEIHLRGWGRPFLFALATAVVTALVDLATTSTANFWQEFLTWRVAALSLLAAFIERLFAWREFSKDEETLKALKEILSRLSFPVAEYAKRKMARAINEINNDLRRLESDVLVGQTFADKMEIIESLLHDVRNDLTRYWATTLDKPSRMWREAYRFFELQDKMLAGVADKKRIVVLSLAGLREEIEDSTDDDALERFIGWHEDPKRNFQLLFLIDSRNEFAANAQQFLSHHLQAHHVVTDFAIMGDKWVYGEVAATRGDDTDGNKALRLYEAKPIGRVRVTVVDDYKRFYEALLNRWEGYTWPIMSPQQILSERSRCRVRKTHFSNHRAEIDSYYSALTGGADLTAPKCFDAIHKLLTCCKGGDHIIAVDIAPLKSRLRVWIEADEYNQWIKATISAAKNGCEFKRVYILNERFGVRQDAEEVYDKIFAPQLDAGVEIWVCAARELWEQGVPMHDFLLVRNRMCMSLTWEERFDRQTLCVDKNLEHPAAFDWYGYVFANIVASPASKNLSSGVTREQALDYLASLRW